MFFFGGGGLQTMLVEMKLKKFSIRKKNMNSLEVLEYYITVANKLLFAAI